MVRDSSLPGTLDVRFQAPLLDGAEEFLRMWAKSGDKITCFIDPAALGPDPFGFGMAMVDAVRHGAKAYARAVGITEEHALARIWAGFDAERGHPTDDPREIADKEGLN